VFQPGPDADRFPVGGAFAYAVTAWCPAPKAAFDYIAFVANAANARTFLSDVGSFPANNTIDHSLFTDPSAKQIAAWLAAGRTGPQFTGKLPMAVDDAIQRECQRLLNGETDVAGALAAIQYAATAETIPAEPVPIWVLALAAFVLFDIIITIVVLKRRRSASQQE
jgi:maltose-binding protein MalE